MITGDTESMYSLEHLVLLAVFAGFAFWTCSFVSDAIVGVFRKGVSYLPKATKVIAIYLAGGGALGVVLAGMVLLLVEVLEMPIELFGEVSYAQIAFLAIFVGIATTATKILFPNLFLQGRPKNQ